jgi:hypothetical protein
MTLPTDIQPRIDREEFVELASSLVRVPRLRVREVSTAATGTAGGLPYSEKPDAVSERPWSCTLGVRP